MKIGPKAFDLIIFYEIGGGKTYYEKFLKHPTWPGGQSGVTIGVGYDLGYNSAAEFCADWSAYLPAESIAALKSACGKKGQVARNYFREIKKIEVPWEAAMQFFKEKTLPRFEKLTAETFPGSEDLHPDAFGALVSLVFNRGSSLAGPRRTEMAKIKELIEKKEFSAIPEQFRKMKRLWIGKGLDGLLKRRDAEANLFADAIKA